MTTRLQYNLQEATHAFLRSDSLESRTQRVLKGCEEAFEYHVLYNQSRERLVTGRNVSGLVPGQILIL